MPEGPEIRFMSELINKLASGRTFSHISRSVLATHERKHPSVDIPASWAQFTVSACARGKELQVRLENAAPPSLAKRKTWPATAATGSVPTAVTLLFRAGMSGYFILKESGKEFLKHAHLRFHVIDTDEALCFVDMRRFGSWQVTDDWGTVAERGPDILSEPMLFVENVQRSVGKRAFDAAIAEVLLDQQFFNGLGNYLRAEILHRANISPFVRARDVLTATTATATATTTAPVSPPTAEPMPLSPPMPTTTSDLHRDGAEHAQHCAKGAAKAPGPAGEETQGHKKRKRAKREPPIDGSKMESSIESDADDVTRRDVIGAQLAASVLVAFPRAAALLAQLTGLPDLVSQYGGAIAEVPVDKDSVTTSKEKKNSKRSLATTTVAVAVTEPLLAAASDAKPVTAMGLTVYAAGGAVGRGGDGLGVAVGAVGRGGDGMVADALPLPAVGSPAATLLAMCVRVVAESLAVLRVHGFYDDCERSRPFKVVAASASSASAIPTFHEWLRCYTKLSDAVDGIGRRIWFAPHHRAVKALAAGAGAGAGDDAAVCVTEEGRSLLMKAAPKKKKKKKKSSASPGDTIGPDGSEESKVAHAHARKRMVVVKREPTDADSAVVAPGQRARSKRAHTHTAPSVVTEPASAPAPAPGSAAAAAAALHNDFDSVVAGRRVAPGLRRNTTVA